MKCNPTLFLCAVAFCLYGKANAQTTAIYATDFEANQFALGALQGQQGFVAHRNKSNSAAKIVVASTLAETRSLQIKGSSLSTYSTTSNRYAAYYDRSFDFNPLSANKPKMILRSDMAFFANGSSVPTVAGLQFYTLGGDLISGMLISEDGSLIGFNDDMGSGTEVQRTVTLEAYHTLTLYADYNARMTEFYVDGDLLGLVPFTNSTGNDFGDLDFFYSASGAQPTADVNFDTLSIEATATGSTLVTGQVDVQAITNPIGSPVRFDFRPTIGTAFTRNAVLSANGTFTLGGIPAGTYRVLAQAPRHLKRAFNLTANGTTVSNLRVQLKAGDINEDNAIDFGDLSTLLQAYNALEGESLYAAYAFADINGDGGIDFGDLSIMLQNYNELGDE